MSQDNHAAGNVYTALQGRDLDTLSNEEIRAIAEEWLLIAIQGHDVLTRASSRLRREKNNTLSPEQVHIENNTATETAEKVRRKHAAIHKAALAQRELSHMEPKADRMLTAHGVNVSPEQKQSHQYFKTCEELTKAHILFYRLQEAYAEGDFSVYEQEVQRLTEAFRQRTGKGSTGEAPEDIEAAQAVTAAGTAITMANNDDEGSIPLSEAVTGMLNAKALDGSWRPKVAEMERKKFELFLAVIDPGNSLPVNGLRAKHLSRYKEILLRMPASRSTKKAYRDMSLPDLIKLVESGGIPKEQRMQNNTIKTYCQSLTTFINWAAKREYHNNPNAAGVAAVKAKADEHAESLREVMTAIQASGITTTNGIADELNRRRIATPREGKWYPSSVKRSLTRLKDVH